MRRRFDQEDEDWEEEENPKGISRGEMTGAVMAGAILLYGLMQGDLPVIFLTASFLLWQLRVFALAFGPEKAGIVKNVLQGLCLSLFIGAVILLFF